MPAAVPASSVRGCNGGDGRRHNQSYHAAALDVMMDRPQGRAPEGKAGVQGVGWIDGVEEEEHEDEGEGEGEGEDDDEEEEEEEDEFEVGLEEGMVVLAQWRDPKVTREAILRRVNEIAVRVWRRLGLVDGHDFDECYRRSIADRLRGHERSERRRRQRKRLGIHIHPHPQIIALPLFLTSSSIETTAAHSTRRR